MLTDQIYESNTSMEMHVGSILMQVLVQPRHTVEKQNRIQQNDLRLLNNYFFSMQAAYAGEYHWHVLILETSKNPPVYDQNF